MSKVLLGSMSPGRKHVLEKFGFDFDSYAPNINEKSHNGNISFLEATNLVLLNSKLKLDAILDKKDVQPYSAIITSDTTVFCNNKIYEKTYDKLEARTLLLELAGKSHKVITGVSLYFRDQNDENKKFVMNQFYDVTDVIITQNKSLIDFYLQFDDCLGKAGCYGVQGAGSIIIEDIKGSIDNVIGLPMSKIIEKFEKLLLNLLKTSNDKKNQH